MHFSRKEVENVLANQRPGCPYWVLNCSKIYTTSSELLLTDWCLTQTLAIFHLYRGVRTTKKNIHDESVDWTCSGSEEEVKHVSMM